MDVRSRFKMKGTGVSRRFSRIVTSHRKNCTLLMKKNYVEKVLEGYNMFYSLIKTVELCSGESMKKMSFPPDLKEKQ